MHSIRRAKAAALSIQAAWKTQPLPMAMALAASILWICSLYPTALELHFGQEKSLSGLKILVLGWLSPLVFNFAWFSNLLFAYSVVRFVSGETPFKASMAAALLSLDTLRFSEFVLNEGGATTPVYGYGWGAVLWLLAIFLMLAAVGARRRRLGVSGDWLQPAGAALCALIVGIAAYFSFHDRAIANAAETERLSGIAFKRGKVCSAGDPIVGSPIRQPGVVEIVVQGRMLHARYPFAQVKNLLDWGIPRLRYENMDYTLALFDPKMVCFNLQTCKALKSEPPIGAASALLYVSEVHMRTINVKLVEPGTKRTVFDQTWIREDYPVDKDIYCPAYKGFPGATEQPRLLLTQALSLRAPDVNAGLLGGKGPQ